MLKPLISLALLASCGLTAPPSGEVVAPGVARAVFDTRTNGTDLVPVTVLFPADDDGRATSGPHPGVVFVQGGLVPTSRYQWQAVELARAGMVVAIPENQLALAFFSVNYGLAARQLLVDPPRGSALEGVVDPARLAVAGHSLGSVVAIKLALAGGFDAMVVEAGFPDTADVKALASFSKPSLSLAGSLDCAAKLDAVRSGWEQLPSPTVLGVLDGVTHYQFTDSDAEDRPKCLPSADLADAHFRITQATVGFLNAAFSDGSVGRPALEAVPGLTVESR